MAAVQNQGRILDKLTAILDSTQNGLIPLAGQLLNSQRNVLDSVLKVGEIYQKWHNFCELPANLQEGMTDTFCASFEQWTNKWERRRRSDPFGGYKTLPFVSKETLSTGIAQEMSQTQGQSVQRQAPPSTNEPRAGIWGPNANYQYSYEETPDGVGPLPQQTYAAPPGKEWFYAKMAADAAYFSAEQGSEEEEVGHEDSKESENKKRKEE